jgi:hypothetical protein
MSTKWFLWRALGTLVVVILLAGLLTVGGIAAYRTGWSQGYATGQLAVEREESEVMPTARPYAPYGLSTGLIGIGLFLLLLVVIGKIFRWLTWRTVMTTGGPWPTGAHPHHWSRHWRHDPRRYGPVPPWCWDWEGPSEEKPKAEPDAETGAAEL